MCGPKLAEVRYLHGMVIPTTDLCSCLWYPNMWLSSLSLGIITRSLHFMYFKDRESTIAFFPFKRWYGTASFMSSHDFQEPLSLDMLTPRRLCTLPQSSISTSWKERREAYTSGFMFIYVPNNFGYFVSCSNLSQETRFLKIFRHVTMPLLRMAFIHTFIQFI